MTGRGHQPLTEPVKHPVARGGLPLGGSPLVAVRVARPPGPLPWPSPQPLVKVQCTSQQCRAAPHTWVA